MIFGLLSLGMIISTQFKQIKIGKMSLFIGSIIFFLFALVEELSQYFMTLRTFDVYDLIADTLGIILFTLLVNYRMKFLELRKFMRIIFRK